MKTFYHTYTKNTSGEICFFVENADLLYRVCFAKAGAEKTAVFAYVDCIAQLGNFFAVRENYAVIAQTGVLFRTAWVEKDSGTSRYFGYFGIIFGNQIRVYAVDRDIQNNGDSDGKRNVSECSRRFFSSALTCLYNEKCPQVRIEL